MWHAPWGSTIALVPSSSMRGRASADRVFRKDAVALIKTAQDNEVPLRIVETVAAVNDTRKRAMARKVLMPLTGASVARRLRSWG